MPKENRKSVSRSHAGSYMLLDGRPPATYNEHEARFSQVLQHRVNRLLSGERNDLLLLRKYYGNPDRIGITGTTPDIDATQLRLPIIEKMLADTLVFMHDGTPGSAPARSIDRGGRVLETQKFTTKWPHILVVRTDVFDQDDGELLETVWHARRIQNQRAQIRINRLLDLANLGLEFVRLSGSNR